MFTLIAVADTLYRVSASEPMPWAARGGGAVAGHGPGCQVDPGDGGAAQASGSVLVVALAVHWLQTAL